MADTINDLDCMNMPEADAQGPQKNASRSKVNEGTLFPNKFGKSERSPNWSGKAVIECPACRSVNQFQVSEWEYAKYRPLRFRKVE